MIKDSFGRPITSIRISITQKCNLCCIYCHREGEESSYTEMTPEEIQRIVGIAASFNIRSVKLTGGEPLLRSDILEIVKRITDTPKLSEVSMTTNGTLLKGFAKPLKEVGLTRVNVSLDTLDLKTYRFITRSNELEMVVAGIKESVKAGLSPVKVNMVLLKGVNDDQVWNMINFARENSLILQLIELESASEDQFYQKYHFDLFQIEKELEGKAEKTIVRSMHHRKKYFLPGDVEVEVVKPMHNKEFCQYCTRIRVTSDGKLKPCLFRSNNLVDILSSIRNRASEEDVKELFMKAVKRRIPYFT